MSIQTEVQLNSEKRAFNAPKYSHAAAKRKTMRDSLVQQLHELRSNQSSEPCVYSSPSYTLPVTKTTRFPIDQQLAEKSVTYYLLNFSKNSISVKLEDEHTANIKVYKPPRVQRRFYHQEPTCEEIVGSFRHRDIPNENTVTLIVRSQTFNQYFDNFWYPNKQHWKAKCGPAVVIKAQLSDDVLSSIVHHSMDGKVRYKHDVYFLEVKVNSQNCRKYRLTNSSHGHVIFHMLDRCRRTNTESSARAISMLLLAVILCTIQAKSGYWNCGIGMWLYWIVFYSVLMIYPSYFFFVYFYYRNKPVIYQHRPGMKPVN